MKNIILLMITIIVVFMIISFFKENFIARNYTIDNLDYVTENVRVLISDYKGNLTTTALIPSGTIAMWNGTTPPNGWVLCDGSEYILRDETSQRTVRVPNLIDKFVKSIGSNISLLNSTGGNEKITLTSDHLPKHKHNNTCSVTPTIGNSGAHTHSGTLNLTGEHTHTYAGCSISSCDRSDNENSSIVEVTEGKPMSHAWNSDDSDVIYSNHKHNLTYSSNGAHNHTVSTDCTITASSSGNNTTINNEPEYYVLAYIYKL